MTAPRKPWQSARRRLRSPRLIVAELVLLSLASVALTIVPQIPADPAAAARFQEKAGALAPVLSALQLDRILDSWWFLALLTVCGASLAIVTFDQWRTALRLWGERPSQASFQAAPYRAEWTRPPSAEGPSARFTTTGRASLLGSPLFHLGLLLVTVAGFVRMLWATSAVVDVFEAETVPSTPAAFGAQWPGRLAAPLALERPLAFERLRVETYPSGGLRRLSADVRLEGEAEGRTLAVNSPLRLGLTSVYLTQTYGPAALLELTEAGSAHRVVALLQPEGDDYSAKVALGALEVRLRGGWGPGGAAPRTLEARVLRGGSLVYADLLGPGRPARLDGGELAIVDVRRWSQLVATRDPSTPIAYAGFVLCLLGTVLMFVTVKVDTAVVVEAAGSEERVLVALKARRFAPLFQERFAALVRAHGGPGGAS